MAESFDRDALLEAFDEIGRAAVAAGTRLQIQVYGGSALMLASNFRFATEQVDIAEIGGEWPDWLSDVVARIARVKDWSVNWFNDAVTFHHSALERADRDLLAFGTFPRSGETVGLCVMIPTARYMLAMKLKSLRVSDFSRGEQDMTEVAHLLRVVGIKEIEPAIEVLAEFFPKSAADADKQRFVLKRLFAGGLAVDAPEYPRTGG